jgi:transketolase
MAQTIDGHSFAVMDRAFASLPAEPEKPTAIIAKTVRGKGVPSIERRADRWFVHFTSDEVLALLRELHGEGAASLTSETLMVR